METTQLPLWVEYVKALGTPLVALIAATIAGGIAYRQWRTARNKLKLDFFDKRMEIYTLAVDALETVRRNEKADFSCVEKLESKLHAARWLYDRNVEIFLNEMCLAVIEELKKLPSPKDEMSEEEFAWLLASASLRQDSYKRMRRSLDKTIAPFLSLKH